MVKAQKYDDLSTSELARLTRERGLDKPAVGDSGAWAAWLREQDSAPASVVAQAATAAPDYKHMSKVNLVVLAQERGLADASANTKAELADWLLASDGVSEDQQAAQDNASKSE